MTYEWHRVSRHRPCEICNHTDWCTYNDAGSCCMRLESTRPMHNGGWWFPADGGAGAFSSGRGRMQPKNKAGPVPPPQDFARLIARWRSEKAGELEPYAATLGVGKQDLDDLGVCYAPEYKAFAFPMCNPEGETVGIRLRNDFHKWSVKGGHQGLFIPFAAIRRMPIDTVMVVEGPTDTAAGLALGFFTIGRPNNLIGGEMVAAVLAEIGCKHAIVVYDNDEHIDSMGKRIRPGPLGAERVIKQLKCRVTKLVPPTKDLRSFLCSGGSRAAVESLCLQ